MPRPIARKLLDKATAPGAGPVFLDMESVTVASLQFVFTGKRVAVAIKGRPQGSHDETTLSKLDSLTWKSGDTRKINEWPPGIEEIWAEVTVIDSGEVSLYFNGKE